MRNVLYASLMALLLSNCALATEKPMLIDQIPIDTKTFAPTDGETVEQFPDQKAALQQELQRYLQGKYEFFEERFMVLNSRGAMIESGISDYVYSKLKGKQLQGDILPHASIIDVWEAQGKYLVFASSSPLPDGNSIYALAELKPIDK